ncbi:VWA domain-containing protein [Desulfonema ishimotonii]|uniref:VWA domain-containing protein n=1 Tax=Desulfonema ishimotonii TaxID=45657 RepID=A0A401FTI6_9BACT|nr:VWA domain-containing protein [Desulfonema ishimotonii]GBC60275.1 VWA domain-containing protein [Desulfonema ishimotonii]
MKKQYMKPLILISGLIAVTCGALAYSGHTRPSPRPDPSPLPVSAKNGTVTLSGNLTQDKIFTGGDGTASLALTIGADEEPATANAPARHVDMVIVLDRSGSMDGEKIRDARQAVLKLLDQLSPRDRFALVSYSDAVCKHADLCPVTDAGRERLTQAVSRISAGGGTNLGAGLQQGLQILSDARKTGNLGRVILISDGLANEGITDPQALGQMAAVALKKEFAVSTVGVGDDFNEQLMTAIADRGTGNYYYLENPGAFARVFEQEFRNTRTAVATALEIRVPLPRDVSLIHAAGYPVQIRDNAAVFYPGDLRAGQTRKLFLTFRLPTHAEKAFSISDISARYLRGNEPHSVTLSDPFRIACVKDRQAAFASVKKETWETQVLKNDYNTLKEKVASAIRGGREEEALESIQAYRVRQQAVNDVVRSEKVAENLSRDVAELREQVKDTFAGAADEVALKQKRNAKSLQFEGYQGKRK